MSVLRKQIKRYTRLQQKTTKHEQQRTYVKNKISALLNYFTCQTKAMVQCNLCGETRSVSSCLTTAIR